MKPINFISLVKAKRSIFVSVLKIETSVTINRISSELFGYQSAQKNGGRGLNQF